MATNYGNPIIEPLESNSDQLEEWIERFEAAASVHPSVISATTDAIKAPLLKNLLIQGLGNTSYIELKNHLLPDKIAEKSYEELIAELRGMCPESTAIAQSYKLSLLRQEASETIQQFMTRVKLVAAKCDFDALFDRMVRDRFIHGLRDEGLRTKLVDDSKVKFSKIALKTAVEKQQNRISAHQMGGTASVHAVRENRPGVVCSKCTLRGHLAQDCRITCKFCHRPGHIVKNCFKKKGNSNRVNVADMAEELEPTEEPGIPMIMNTCFVLARTLRLVRYYLPHLSPALVWHIVHTLLVTCLIKHALGGYTCLINHVLQGTGMEVGRCASPIRHGVVGCSRLITLVVGLLRLWVCVL